MFYWTPKLLYWWAKHPTPPSLFKTIHREHCCSVVECLTRDRGTAGSSLTDITVLCPSATHIYPSLGLVPPRKAPPTITERLLVGTWRIKLNPIHKKGCNYLQNNTAEIQYMLPYHNWANKFIATIVRAATYDFQQCGILTCVDSDEPVQPHIKLRNSKWCSVSSLTYSGYSSD